MIRFAVPVDGVAVVFETIHGSRAYSLATASPDTAVRGVFVPPPLARKFFRLAATCNPTVIEVLFTDPADHRAVSPEGAGMLARREELLSRRAGDSFGRSPRLDRGGAQGILRLRLGA